MAGGSRQRPIRHGAENALSSSSVWRCVLLRVRRLLRKRDDAGRPYERQGNGIRRKIQKAALSEAMSAPGRNRRQRLATVLARTEEASRREEAMLSSERGRSTGRRAASARPPLTNQRGVGVPSEAREATSSSSSSSRHRRHGERSASMPPRKSPGAGHDTLGSFLTATAKKKDKPLGVAVVRNGGGGGSERHLDPDDAHDERGDDGAHPSARVGGKLRVAPG